MLLSRKTPFTPSVYWIGWGGGWVKKNQGQFCFNSLADGSLRKRFFFIFLSKKKKISLADSSSYSLYICTIAADLSLKYKCVMALKVWRGSISKTHKKSEPCCNSITFISLELPDARSSRRSDPGVTATTVIGFHIHFIWRTGRLESQSQAALRSCGSECGDQLRRQ